MVHIIEWHKSQYIHVSPTLDIQNDLHYYHGISSICVYVHMYVCMHVCMCWYVGIHTYTSIYDCVQMCAWVRGWVYIGHILHMLILLSWLNLQFGCYYYAYCILWTCTNKAASYIVKFSVTSISMWLMLQITLSCQNVAYRSHNTTCCRREGGWGKLYTMMYVTSWCRADIFYFMSNQDNSTYIKTCTSFVVRTSLNTQTHTRTQTHTHTDTHTCTHEHMNTPLSTSLDDALHCIAQLNYTEFGTVYLLSLMAGVKADAQ